MHDTKIQVVHHHGRIPLALRGRFERIFLGLGLFAAGPLFLCGVYLLTEAIRDPLGASETSVIAAGFTLALASFLIIFLLWPRGGPAKADREDLEGLPEEWDGPVLTVYGRAVQNRMDAERMLGEEKKLPGPM